MQRYPSNLSWRIILISQAEIKSMCVNVFHVQKYYVNSTSNIKFKSEKEESGTQRQSQSKMDSDRNFSH